VSKSATKIVTAAHFQKTEFLDTEKNTAKGRAIPRKKADSAAVYGDSLRLQVWLPNFFGVALRKADITAVLFAFAGEFAFLHGLFLLEFQVLIVMQNRGEVNRLPVRADLGACATILKYSQNQEAPVW
jgi:hypothetical protein